MRVRLHGPLAEFELRHWSLKQPGDQLERFADSFAAASMVRGIIRESTSFGLRTLVERIDGSTLGFVDEQALIERLADALVRGTIVAIRTPHTIIATQPPERVEVYEPLEPEPIVEPESVWLRPSAEAEWLSLSVSAEPETLEFETSHQALGG